MLIEKTAIEAAGRNIAAWLRPTPLIRSEHFSRRLKTNIWFKLETLQPTHSFKVRGAFNALLHLPASIRARGVITASGGNHGLAVAHAAKSLGVPARVYLPQSATPAKLAPLNDLGAEIVIHGAAWDEANSLALQVADESKRAYIHPFDNRDVMAGQATIIAELISQLPQFDLIVSSIGGGGLISGIASAVRHYTPRTQVVGVETEGADSMYQSLKAGRIVELPAITSIAETLGARRTAPTQFGIVSAHVSNVVTVSDNAAIRALLELLEQEKLLTEPATSCSLAALLEGRVNIASRENVVVVLCGANIAPDQICTWNAEMRGARMSTQSRSAPSPR
jgi:threonine dehydratase